MRDVTSEGQWPDGSAANPFAAGETASPGALISRACPMCGRTSDAKDVKVRAPVRSETLEDDQRDEYWRGFRSRACFFDFARCPSCSLLYSPTYFSQASLDRLYSSMPDNTAGAAPDVLSDTQSGYISFLAKQRPLSGTYLEIGPDIGLATQAAFSTGTLDRAILIEPNRAVHDELRETTGPVPVEIAESLDDLQFPAQADNVILIHVLDHLIDPLTYLRDLRRHLAPGALLLAVVHNEASLLRRVLGTRWPPFCLQHPQVFSKETLADLLVAAEFSVVASRPTTNVFPLQHVVRTAASLLGIEGKWTERLPKTKIRLRLGNMMIVARA
jgi:SAM-dependent methyltransferase